MLVVVVGLVSFALLHESKREPQISPDGRFYAVVSSRTWRSFVPAMPGGGSDKPGFVTVYTRDGRSCGRKAVPMVWAGGIAWLGRYAETETLQRWDLRACAERHEGR